MMRSIGVTHVVVNTDALSDETAQKAMDICPVGALLPKRRAYQVPIGERTFDRQPIREVAITEARQVKELNLFSLPFLSQDHAGLDAITGSEAGKRIIQIVDKAGVMPLAWGENGFRELTNSRREIRSLICIIDDPKLSIKLAAAKRCPRR